MHKKENESQIQKVTIDPKGSLGLLAIGDLGLRAWRDVKKKHNNSTEHDES